MTCDHLFVAVVPVMSATRPAKGHPRRTEAVKRLKLRQSTFLLWNERKGSLGLTGISNSEFAEMLLHQNFEGTYGKGVIHKLLSFLVYFCDKTT